MKLCKQELLYDAKTVLLGIREANGAKLPDFEDCYKRHQWPNLTRDEVKAAWDEIKRRQG